MTRKKQLILIGMVGLMMLAGWLIATPAGVSSRNATRLGPGMTEDAVAAILNKTTNKGK
jgi:hypothetical protein